VLEMTVTVLNGYESSYLLPSCCPDNIRLNRETARGSQRSRSYKHVIASGETQVLCQGLSAHLILRS
jgi:hypothetical protein